MCALLTEVLLWCTDQTEASVWSMALLRTDCSTASQTCRKRVVGRPGTSCKSVAVVICLLSDSLHSSVSPAQLQLPADNSSLHYHITLTNMHFRTYTLTSKWTAISSQFHTLVAACRSLTRYIPSKLLIQVWPQCHECTCLLRISVHGRLKHTS